MDASPPAMRVEEGEVATRPLTTRNAAGAPSVLDLPRRARAMGLGRSTARRRGLHRAVAAPAALGPPLGGPDGWTDLVDYGVIGNLRTAVLVSRYGTIDWACLPGFSDPSVFGRLLDRRRGGYARVAPLEWSESSLHYLPGTNVLRTDFTVGANRHLLVTDFMPLAPAYVSRDDARIVRRVEAVGGPVPIRVDVDPRFDYGRAGSVRWDRGSAGRLVGRAGEHEITFRSPWPWRSAEGVAHSHGIVRSNRPRFLSIEWGDAPGPEDPEVLLAATIRFWRNWVNRPDAPLHRAAHVWHDWVERSELLLKLLSSRASGAFVAAPTTSLPEWVGGPRNWDYRYAWVRDAAFAAQAFLLLGHVREAREYVRWVAQRLFVGRARRRLGTLYEVSGGPAPSEFLLDHWEGYRGSSPVRVGNLAVEQLQLDVFGEVMDAVGQLAYLDLEFVRREWGALALLVEAAARAWTRPDSGIWEFRLQPAHYVHSKVMCWVAVQRGAQIANLLGDDVNAERWRRTAAAIHELILERGYDPELGAFIQAFDRPVLDASTLRLPMTGFLPFDDPRVRGTVRVIESELARGPFVYRYANDDGLPGPEGSFQLCSFWLVECLARGGERARAIRNFRQLLRTAGPLRLFSEEYDPTTRRALGNYPQAFTHIGLLRAALAIGARE
jgi:GH15 family glucan-1,4-alpha-glucosidase